MFWTEVLLVLIPIFYMIALFHRPHPRQHRRWILETNTLVTWGPTASWGSYEWCVRVHVRVWVCVCEWVSECVWVCVCVCVWVLLTIKRPLVYLFGGCGLCGGGCWCQHRYLFPQAMGISWCCVQLCIFCLHTRMYAYVYNWTCVCMCVRGAVGVWCHQSLSVGPYLPPHLLSITYTHSQWFQKWEIFIG